MKTHLILPLVAIMSATSAFAFPSAKISNGLVEASVCTAVRTADDSCQGTRFDRLGVVLTLNYKGHSYFDEWYKKFSLDAHHSVTGPVEEFAVMDYDKTPVGGGFMKIGVGILKRPDSTEYNFRRTYEIIDSGKRSVATYPDRVEYVHELDDAKGTSYIYTKTLRLVPGKPRLLIEHSLKNTGKNPIVTTVYNHNFFVIDNALVGPDIELTIPFPPNGEVVCGIGDAVIVKGNKFTFPALIGEKQGAIRSMKGSNSVADYDFRLDNVKTSAGVRMLADRPVLHATFWACNSSACIEPFIEVSAEPGKTFTWKNIYDFYAK